MNIKLLTASPALLSLAFLLVATPSLADTNYQPFILASVNETGLEEQTEATLSALEQAGFTIAGHYSPLQDANVIVVTNPDLQALAAMTDRGGYGAGIRVSVALRNDQAEVAFVNPVYLQYAYRMEGDMQGIQDQLSQALGNKEAFGTKKKMNAKKLGKYHYMVGMERFDNPYELGTFETHEDAVNAVEAGLAVAGDALTQVYRIDIPGKEQTVIGVGMKAVSEDKKALEIDAQHQMAIVDFEGYSKAAYLPYEILINNTDVEALHMRFRMAVHFPSLSMMGKHGFTKLKSAPKATQGALEEILVTD